MIDNIVFDLDGTLVESAEDIIGCLQKAYDILPRRGKVVIQKYFIGPPLSEIIKRATPELNSEDIEKVLRRFRWYYDQDTLEKTQLKEYAADTLRQLTLKNKSIFLVTNKPAKPTRIILNNLRLTCFRDVITPDSEPDLNMNKSEMVFRLKNKWNLAGNATLLVGDTASDVHAARENNFVSAVVLNGYGDVADINKSVPEYLIKNLRELLDIT